jgi:hypothetical protein
MPTVAILTCANDLHALTVQRRFQERCPGACVIVEADLLAASAPGLTWRGEQDGAASLPIRGGGSVDIAAVGAFWYRRANLPQQAVPIEDPDQRSYVDHSVNATLLGMLAAGFTGRWISAPEATRRAENKILQLQAAMRASLAVPRTLVSQDPALVRQFYQQMGGQVVMKALRFVKKQPLLTLRVEPQHLEDDDAIRLCPTIFQELIAGRRHLRVLCCGERVDAIAVDSDDLDWRPQLDIVAEAATLDAATVARLQAVLRALGLRMGVFDLKLRDGVPVFLEVNPQGQFLFMEGMTGIDIATGFAKFLHDEAVAAQRSRH